MDSILFRTKNETIRQSERYLDSLLQFHLDFVVNIEIEPRVGPHFRQESPQSGLM
jgi:hypothetical protein